MANENIKFSSMLRVGTLLRNIYRIDRYLSSGGFGNTYVATNVEFDEVVAIKEFFIKGVSQRDSNKTTVSVSNSDNFDLFDKQLQKFKKEARRIRKLKNGHIVQVHDLFEENGTAYYVMDYIDGESLSERMDRTHKPLSENEVLQYYPQVLDALKAVHDKGIFHLDLKPGNIMVDAQGTVKLIDFGASKQQDNEKGAKDSNSTLMCYTNGYAPREQMERSFDKIGPWTDIYALGATLYALLTHQQPPMPTDIDDDRSPDKHLALPLPEYVSEETRDLVLKLMKTNRLDRPQSVDELLIEDDVDLDNGGGTLIDFSKEFEGWKDTVKGKYYYQGYYNSMETVFERLKGAKTMDEGVQLKAEAKKILAELTKSVELYDRFFNLDEDKAEVGGVSYDWSLISNRLRSKDTSLNNLQLQALMDKFVKSKKPIIPPKPKPKPDPLVGKSDKDSFFKKHKKAIVISSIAAVAWVILVISPSQPNQNETISKIEKLSQDSIFTPKKVDKMAYTHSVFGSGAYTGTLDSEGRPHDKNGHFENKSTKFEYTGNFTHGIATGDATSRLDDQMFKGVYKDNYYENGKLTVATEGYYFVGSFKKQKDKDGKMSSQPYNGTYYDSKSGKADGKVVNGKETAI